MSRLGEELGKFWGWPRVVVKQGHRRVIWFFAILIGVLAVYLYWRLRIEPNPDIVFLQSETSTELVDAAVAFDGGIGLISSDQIHITSEGIGGMAGWIGDVAGSVRAADTSSSPDGDWRSSRIRCLGS